MIVLFEGVDGGGKSTLLKRLLKTFPNSEELEWPGRRDNIRDFLVESKDFIYKHKDKVNSSNLYFVDRCGLGEFIYGPLMEGREMATTEEYADIFKNWLKGKLIILCINPNAYKLAIERGEDGPAKEEQFHKYISAAYRNLGNGNKLHLLGYDFTKDPQEYERIVGAILSHRLVEVMNYDIVE